MHVLMIYLHHQREGGATMTKTVAIKMMDKDSAERKEAEKMWSMKFEQMTQEQRVIAAVCLAAFDGIWNK